MRRLNKLYPVLWNAVLIVTILLAYAIAEKYINDPMVYPVWVYLICCTIGISILLYLLILVAVRIWGSPKARNAWTTGFISYIILWGLLLGGPLLYNTFREHNRHKRQREQTRQELAGRTETFLQNMHITTYRPAAAGLRFHITPDTTTAYTLMISDPFVILTEPWQSTTDSAYMFRRLLDHTRQFYTPAAREAIAQALHTQSVFYYRTEQGHIQFGIQDERKENIVYGQQQVIPTAQLAIYLNEKHLAVPTRKRH